MREYMKRTIEFTNDLEEAVFLDSLTGNELSKVTDMLEVFAYDLKRMGDTIKRDKRKFRKAKGMDPVSKHELDTFLYESKKELIEAEWAKYERKEPEEPIHSVIH